MRTRFADFLRLAPIVVAACVLGAAAWAAAPALTQPSAGTTLHQGRGFSADLPSNWSTDISPSGMSSCAAADGKRVTRDASGTTTSIFLGLYAGYRPAAAANAATAVDRLIRTYRADNPGLRVVARQAMRLDGFAAESLSMESATGRDGELERSWVLVAVKDGQQFEAWFTSPARDFDRVLPVFERVASSIRLQAWRPNSPQQRRDGGALPLKRYVSAQPAFVLFKPEDWTVRSEAAGGTLRVAVVDPEATASAEIMFSANAQGRHTTLSLMSARIGELRARHRDLSVDAVGVCRDAAVSCAVASLSYADAGVPTRARYYFHADPQIVSVRSVRAPAARFDAQRATLLEVLANIHVSAGKPPVQARLVERRAPDGSLTLALPAEWRFLAQKGTVLAGAPGGASGFVFTVFAVHSSSYGVNPPPGVIVSGYQPPGAFAPRVFAQFGNRDIRVVGAAADPATAAECPGRIGRACEAADVVLSWTSPEGNACIGGFKLVNAQPGVTGQWFSIVAGIWGPAHDLSRHLPLLEQVAKSFRINDAYASRYIQNGLAQLRLQEQKTRGAMQGLYDAIGANQAAYEDRVARKEASDARGDDYRRGNSYWISDIEGGKVYATDPWGTKDTRTGDRVEGAPYNYIRFEGQNPAHPSENMRELSSYEVQRLGQ